MTWWKTGKPGDKIVCVDDKLCWWPVFPLTKGRVYTVSQISEERFRIGPDTYGVRIGVSIAEDNGAPIAYATWRFRPAHKFSSKAGLAILQRCLRTTAGVACTEKQPDHNRRPAAPVPSSD